MIVKILTRSDASYSQAIDYISNEMKSLGLNLTSYITKKGGKARGISDAGILKWNLSGDDITDWVKQFEVAEEYRKYPRKNNIKLFHTILSFKQEDSKVLTPTILKDLTRQFIKLNNPRGQYVAVPHFDKEHYHVHLVYSAIDRTTGRSLSLRFSERQELQQKLQEYQTEKYPELTSIVPFGKKEKNKERKLTDAEYHIKKRGQQTKKEQVIEMIQEALDQASTTKEFIEKLKEANVPVYSRGGNKLYGVTFLGRNHRFSTLGFTEEISDLERQSKKLQELQEIRKRSQSKEREQTKDTPSVEDRLAAISELREGEQEVSPLEEPTPSQADIAESTQEPEVAIANDASQEEIEQERSTFPTPDKGLADSDTLRRNASDGPALER